MSFPFSRRSGRPASDSTKPASPASGRLVAALRAWPIHVIEIVLLGVLGLYLAGLSSGYDFTDEGYYYQSFAHPEAITNSQTSYYLFGARLFMLVGGSIVAMRFSALIATLAGTGIFLLGVDRFVRHFSPPSPLAAEIRAMNYRLALVSSLLGYTISPPALSYNFQNASCLLAAIGILLWACAEPRTEKLFEKRIVLFLAGFGLLVGLDFFIKFSSSLPLAALGGAFFLAVSGQSLRQKAFLGGMVLVAGGLSALLYFGFWEDFPRWWSGIEGTVGGIFHRGYATREVARYSQEIGLVYRSLGHDFAILWATAAAGALLALALRVRGFPSASALAAAIVGSGLYLGLLGLAVSYASVTGAAFLPFILGLLALLFLVVLACFSLGRKEGRLFARWPMLGAGAVLFLLPYIGAFGTNNPLHLNCLYQLTPWFVLTGWLVEELGRIWQSRWPARLVLPLLAIVAAHQFYVGYWEYPYRAGGDRSAQESATLIGSPASRLRLNEDAHAFVETSRRVLQDHGFHPGDDLLVFFNLPGFVFAMGGQSPGHPWYLQGSAANYDLNLMRLQFIAPERRKRAIIVRNSVEQDWADFLPYLHRAELNFPEDYTLISPPMTSPLTRVPFEIWVPKSRLAVPPAAAPTR